MQQSKRGVQLYLTHQRIYNKSAESTGENININLHTEKSMSSPSTEQEWRATR